MIPRIIKPLSSLVNEQELSRIADCEDKWHYKGAYESWSIFRSEGVQIWLPPLGFMGPDSGLPLPN